MKRSASLCGLLALLLVFAPLASAQETRGTIEGVIKDASGAVLPGVAVEARHKSGATATAVTNAEGHYQFPALTPGSYAIVAMLSGFSPGQRDNIMLTIGQQLRVENHFLGLGVEVEQVGQRLPRGDDRRQLTARPRVVEVGEVTAQRLVVEEH